ncbi:MAG: glycosyltransferase family 2 protein [Microgenomates group bacterium]|nr:glycosyltransferase family 2 protein [Microgenomates group bacterium]
MKKIILSIVVPAYNCQNSIKNLLFSINRSKFRHFGQIETIIVDDRSTDKTIEVIKKIAPQLKFPLRLIRLKKNAGPARARNLGVKKSRGNYILFLDSDVELFPKTLDFAFQLVKKHQVKAFTGLWHYRQKSQKFFPQFKALRDWGYWTIERNRGWRYYLFSTRIAGIEKKLFQKIGGFSESYKGPTVEDIELTYKIEKLAPIKFYHRLMVGHEFEDFATIAKKYFLRSRDWIALYRKRLRFDPVATTPKEALKPIVASLLIFSLMISLFYWPFLYYSFWLFLIYGFLERYFWRFLIKKKGFWFFLKSLPVAIFLYLIIALGSVYGLILSIIKSQK